MLEVHTIDVRSVSCVEENVHHDNHNIHVRAVTQYWATRTFTLDILFLVARTRCVTSGLNRPCSLPLPRHFASSTCTQEVGGWITKKSNQDFPFEPWHLSETQTQTVLERRVKCDALIMHVGLPKQLVACGSTDKTTDGIHVG